MEDYEVASGYTSNELRSLHAQGWDDLWSTGGVEVSGGRMDVAKAANSSYCWSPFPFPACQYLFVRVYIIHQITCPPLTTYSRLSFVEFERGLFPQVRESIQDRIRQTNTDLVHLDTATVHTLPLSV